MGVISDWADRLRFRRTTKISSGERIVDAQGTLHGFPKLHAPAPAVLNKIPFGERQGVPIRRPEYKASSPASPHEPYQGTRLPFLNRRIPIPPLANDDARIPLREHAHGHGLVETYPVFREPSNDGPLHAAFPQSHVSLRHRRHRHRYGKRPLSAACTVESPHDEHQRMENRRRLT